MCMSKTRLVIVEALNITSINTYLYSNMSCAVKGCSNCRRLLSSSANLSFHTFPKNQALLEKWLEALSINKEQWIWSKNKVVCSEHFENDDFCDTYGRRMLRPNCIPSRKLSNVSTSYAVFEDSTLSSSLEKEASTSKSIVQESTSSSLTDQTQIRVQRRRKRKIQTSASPIKTSSGNTSTDSSIKRRRILVKTIHSYSTSPSKIKAKNVVLRKRQEAYRKKLYSAKKTVKALRNEVTDMKLVIHYLEKNQYMSYNAIEHLEKSVDSVPHLLMRRYLKNIKNETITHESYPPVLRQFAATLQFYSGKAYEEVRKEFHMALPHQATIRKWYQNIDCKPGYIDVAFDVLKEKANESLVQNKKLICSLLMDEISLKKQIDFDGKQMWGYVNIGVPIENDEMQAASDALVLMVVSHQSHWKLPIAYFFITSLSGKEKAHIVEECLIRLHEINVVITSVTCDGPVANLTMLKQLGCNLDDIGNLKTWFSHPSDGSQKVFCILDACHMLKLARNNFATLQEFLDPEGQPIKWVFIKRLYELQENEGLRIANKLKRAHMEWYRQKMKVNLAAQTLSKSVADAIEFLDKTIGLEEFAESTATVNFIRRIDHLFDLLNSRSPLAKGNKSPLRASTEHHWRPFVMETIHYLLHCTDVTGRPLCMTPKKTPFIGFSITALSVCGIFDLYVKTEELNYLLTYKVSQDHLEIFFSSIRSRNGWNNNPTCLQFMRTFRRLLLHTKTSQKGGNCKVLDATCVLQVSSSNSKTPEVSVDTSLFRRFSIETGIHLCEHDYDMVPHFVDINLLSLNVVVYISGYVLKTLKKTIKCPECLLACEGPSVSSDDMMYSLISFKNRGGLNIPSYGVIKICKKIEVALRSLLRSTDNKIPSDANFFNIFVMANAQGFYDQTHLFPDLKEHFMESPPLDENHFVILVKNIIRVYTKIRIFSLSKKYTETLRGPAVRNQLNKLILFNHQ